MGIILNEFKSQNGSKILNELKRFNQLLEYTMGDVKPLIFEQDSEQKDIPTLVNKVATEGIKNVTPEMISSPQFKGFYSGYVFGGTFNGTKYEWQCNGVEGMSGVRGMIDGDIISESVDNMFAAIKKPMTDGKPGTPCVGFVGGNSRFIIYTTTEGGTKCIYF
jgi:hypothetical protein